VRLAGWLPFLPDGAFHLRLDGLAAVMLVVVGLVSFCVYVYSLGYMAGDPGQRRFFVYLDFFVASMALLVLAGNLAVLVIGWAGVGLASFLLISFWSDRPGTLGAGLEALAANAVGDAALLLAVVLVPKGCGDLVTLRDCAARPGGEELLATLLLIAAAAKSAQGPLYFWLPSAMAGPTPVSALIHAATMVAAGVYLLVRTHELLALAPAVLLTTAWLGVFTALLSAIASLQQSNFKRGLAYSTVSQLGYMFASVGFGAPFAALFHLITHASFKALLFLSAGIVIHSMDGEEELSELGGLQRSLPAAHWSFLIGSLSLIGVPIITAGAFSKDAVLEAGLHHSASGGLLGALLVGGVFLTGLYIGRLYFAVFGGPTGDHHPHAPSGLLLWPLAPLAVGALTLGYLEFPGGQLAGLLSSSLGHAEGILLASPLGLLAGALGLAGFGAAYLWRQRAGADARLPAARLDWVEASAALGRALAAEVTASHSGRLGTYVLTSIVGTAAVLLLARTLTP
jgi:NADH-quinone oxidoreductase subunit L